MLQEICVHLGKLYMPYHEKEVINVHVFECSRASEESPYRFQNTWTVKRRNVRDIQWFSIASVFSHQTKLKVIILLIRHLKFHKISVYTLIPTSRKGELSEVSSFTCGATFCAVSNDNIAVTDGPTIVYVQESELCIASVMFDLTGAFDLKTYLPNNESFIRILQFGSYETCYKQNKLIVYIIVFQSLNSSEEKNIRVFSILQILESGKFYNEMYDVPNHIFFPPYYQTITSAVLVTGCNASRNLCRKENEEMWNMEHFFEENRTVICTNKNFLFFENGLLKYCCNLTIDDVDRLILAPRNGTSENDSFLLQSSVRGISYATKTEDSKKYECQVTWENAVRVYFGDFLNICAKQILLLMFTDFESWQEESLFLQYSSLTSMARVSETDIPDEHMKTTISSLQNRIMYGKAALIEAETRISEKSSVISSILKGMRNQCSKSSLPGQSAQSSLVDIMNYKDQSTRSCEGVSCESKGLVLRAVDHWQLVLTGHWFMGWVFQNVSDGCVTNLNASLMLQEMEVEYRQRTFIDNSRDFTIKKEVKCHALPGEEIFIVISTEIPAFVSDDIEACCIISWNIGVSNNMVHNALFPNEVNGPCQQQAFEVTLKAKDVLNTDAFTDCSDIYRLMSLRTLQDSILVEITSVNTSLSLLEKLAVQKQKAYPPTLLEIEDTKCLIFMDERSPLFGSNMSWNQLNKNTVEAEIFARTEKALMLFIHWLYSILPQDIGILPKEFTNKERSELPKKLLIALKEEVDTIRMAFTTSKAANNDPEAASSLYKTCHDPTTEDVAVQMTSSEIKKAVTMKEATTDRLMVDFMAANQHP